MYYWCTTADHGASITLDRGGYYEQVEDGHPVELPGGFAKSDVPEVCMSKSPESCLFALSHNVDEATPLYVYQTAREPDIDLSNELWDFGTLEEVRYRNPQGDPIPIEHVTTVELPQRAFDDATESYNPHGPYGGPPEIHVDVPQRVFHSEWAEAVKNALGDALRGAAYPDEIEYVPEYDEYFE